MVDKILQLYSESHLPYQLSMKVKCVSQLLVYNNMVSSGIQNMTITAWNASAIYICIYIYINTLQ